MPLSKVELYAAIRRDARAGMSGRAIERKYRVGRRTVVRALSSAWPGPCKQLPARASKLDPFKPAVDEILRADLDAPRKQRHTITRIYHRLMDEHGMADVSYPVVRAYAAGRKPQIRAEAGRRPAEVFVPQTHSPGDEAEVDFGEVVVRQAGEDVTCFLFCLRLSFSGKAVHGSRCRAGRRPSSRGTRTRSGSWAGRRPGRSATTTSSPRSRRSSGSAVRGWRPAGGPFSAPTGAWMPSTASPASPALMRKAGWKGRSAGSAATTWSRSRTCRRSRR
jgi:transposase